MKREIIFTFACVMALMSGFVSCTNEDFEDSMPVAEMQRSAITRSIGDEITIEEVKARMAELNERYSVNFVINEEAPASDYDNSFFIVVENVMRRNVGLEPIDCTPQGVKTLNLMDDISLDGVNVASTKSVPKEPEGGPIHDPFKVYTGSETALESMSVSKFTNFISDFNIYMWSISYSFTYGARSTISYEGFENQTHYNVDNMPKNGINELLLPSQVEDIAKAYQVSYVEKSMKLEVIPIKYDPNDPESLYEIDIFYSYTIKIAESFFGVLGRYNSRAESVYQISM